MFVSKISESKLAGVEHINEAKIFNGQSNPVILTQEITTTFDCDLYLLYYPFDSQECYIQVSDTQSSEEQTAFNLVIYMLQ